MSELTLDRCRNCRYLDIEHDPVDMKCPDDDDHARANREEWYEGGIDLAITTKGEL